MIVSTICGAQVSAIIYSATETTRANNLNEYYYIDHMLAEPPQLINAKGNIIIHAGAAHAIVKFVAD